MDRVILPQIVSAQLHGLVLPVEVCDEQGLVLGQFVPFSTDDPMSSCPYSEEELEAFRAEKGGRTLEEIWADLSNQ